MRRGEIGEEGERRARKGRETEKRVRGERAWRKKGERRARIEKRDEGGKSLWSMSISFVMCNQH
jgi:hypothetical protein